MTKNLLKPLRILTLCKILFPLKEDVIFFILSFTLLKIKLVFLI